MGYSISWLGVQATPESTHEMLGLRPTGAQVDIPTAAFCGARLGSDWYVVVAKGCNAPLIAPKTLSSVSAKVDVLACSIEEHVMVARACFWSRGSEIWSIEHDAQKAEDDLAEVGELPSFYSEIRDRLLAEQAAEAETEARVDHVFDVPLVTAQRITGFKHDEGGEPSSFSVLERSKGSILTPWWKVW